MKFDFIGFDNNNNISTITSIEVEEIDYKSYEDDSINNEIDSFVNGEVTYYRIKEDISGFSRNYGGESKREGLYVHNRVFKTDEDPINHLALQDYNNTAEEYTLIELHKGARIAVGSIANGKGMQARISKSDLNKINYKKFI